MSTWTEPAVAVSRDRSSRWRSAGYWVATALVSAELGLGGLWDIARLPFVRDLVLHLGRRRQFTSAQERARIAVRKAIVAALDRIEQVFPILAG